MTIITKIPIFVWPLFIVLLIGGLRARKTNLVPLKVLLLIPAAFFGWSLFGFFRNYANDFLAIFLWVLCLGTGGSLGFLHIQKLKLQFYKTKKMVEMPGSWIPLILSMSIFTSKFSVEMMRSILPNLEGSLLILGLELFSIFILGIFAGRGICCFLRYRSNETEVSDNEF